MLERDADPRALQKLTLLTGPARGAWREPKADDLRAAAEESIELWAGGGLDFEELAGDIATQVRLPRNLNGEIAARETTSRPSTKRPTQGHRGSVPGIGVTLAAGVATRIAARSADAA